uniref:hypothetical protein n=1 Tax=Paractinoplanes polyasparticus TaxID=2856853 RepID=UPI001C86673F|nr:hypothetical protein [Actinoplanes polyasparticus]
MFDALRAGEEALSRVDLEGDPREVLTRLLTSSWALVSESAALLAAAEKVLPEGRVRQLHADAAEEVRTGRLRESEVPGIVTRTVLSILTGG